MGLMPSAKWWASTTVTVLTVIVAVIAAAADQGVELPEIIFVIGAVLAPIVHYYKRETNPSPSARATIAAEQV